MYPSPYLLSTAFLVFHKLRMKTVTWSIQEKKKEIKTHVTLLNQFHAQRTMSYIWIQWAVALNYTQAMPAANGIGGVGGWGLCK